MLLKNSIYTVYRSREPALSEKSSNRNLTNKNSLRNSVKIFYSNENYK